MAQLCTTSGVEVADHPLCGRSLRATRDFVPGETVLGEEPLICAPRQWDSEDPLYRDVPTHAIPHIAAMAQVCAATHDVQQQVLDLFCPALDRSEEVVAHCREAVDHVLNHLDDFPWAVGIPASQLQHFAVAFNLNGHRFQETSRALFALGSKLQHSCQPNTRYGSAEGIGNHVAIEHIAKGDWLSTNYLGPWTILSTPRRQQRLFSTKLFVCHCPRCTGPDYSRQLPCPKCHPRNPEEPTLPKEVGLELNPVSYVLCRPERDGGNAAESSSTSSAELPQQAGSGVWACDRCGHRCSASGLGFDLDLETRLEGHVMALDERLNYDPAVAFDELMKWFMAGMRMLGRRHWLVAKVMLMACEFLESALLQPDELKADQRDYFMDELLGNLTWLWQWFQQARCSPMLYVATFVSGCNALYRLEANKTLLGDLSLYCAWFYPWARLTKGPSADETQAALHAMRYLRQLKNFSDDPAKASAANDTLRDVLKARGNELFAQAANNPLQCWEAIQWYSQAILVCPTEAALYSNRSAAHLLLPSPSAAIADALRCVALRADWPKGHFRLAAAYKAAGRKDDAQAAISAASALAAQDEAVQQLARQIRAMP